MHRGDLSTIRESFFWNSEWYVESKYYHLLFEDLKISNYLTGVFFKLKCPTSSFNIRRLSNNWVVITMDIYIITNIFFKNFYINKNNFHKIYYYIRILLQSSSLYSSNEDSHNRCRWFMKEAFNAEKRYKDQLALYEKSKIIDLNSNKSKVLPNNRSSSNANPNYRPYHKGKRGIVTEAIWLKNDEMIRRRNRQKSLRLNDKNKKDSFNNSVSDQRRSYQKSPRGVGINLEVKRDDLDETSDQLKEYYRRFHKIPLLDDDSDELESYKAVLRERKLEKIKEVNMTPQEFEEQQKRNSIIEDDMKNSNSSVEVSIDNNENYDIKKKLNNKTDEVVYKSDNHRLRRVKHHFQNNISLIKTIFPINKYVLGNRSISSFFNNDSWFNSITTFKHIINSSHSKRNLNKPLLLFIQKNTNIDWRIHRSWWIYHLFGVNIKIVGDFLIYKYRYKIIKDKQKIRFKHRFTKSTSVNYTSKRVLSKVEYMSFKEKSVLKDQISSWFNYDFVINKIIDILYSLKLKKTSLVGLTNIKFKKNTKLSSIKLELKSYNSFKEKIDIILKLHKTYIVRLFNLSGLDFHVLHEDYFCIKYKTCFFFDTIRFVVSKKKHIVSQIDIDYETKNKSVLTDRKRTNLYFFFSKKSSSMEVILYAMFREYIIKELNLNVETISARKQQNNAFFLLEKEFIMSHLFFIKYKSCSWKEVLSQLPSKSINRYCYERGDLLSLSLGDLFQFESSNVLLLELSKKLIFAKNSPKKGLFSTLFYETWCDRSHVRAYLGVLVNDFVKIIIAISLHCSSVLDCVLSLNKSSVMTFLMVNVYTLLKGVASLRNMWSSKKMRTLCYIEKTPTLSYVSRIPETAVTSLKHILNNVEPACTYKNIKRYIRWSQTSLQMQRIVHTMEDSLARYSNKTFVILPTYYYKKKPPLRSSKLLTEYMVFLLRNGCNVHKVFRKIRRWQWKSKWFRFYWSPGVLWKKSVINTLSGIRIVCSGPFRKAKRKRRTHYHLWLRRTELSGKMPLQSMHHKIDYYGSAVRLSYASKGIKVWMVFKPKKEKEENVKK